MVITINSDASFSKRTNDAAYAFKIICDDAAHYCYGPMKSKAKDSTDAEFKAIINGLTAMFILIPTRKIGRIVINTDSLNVVHVLTSNNEAIRKYRLNYLKPLVVMTEMLFAQYDVNISKLHIRHVKAHTDTDDRRSKVNAWCDLKAKEALKQKQYMFMTVPLKTVPELVEFLRNQDR